LRRFDRRVVVFSVMTTLAAGCGSDDGAPPVKARAAEVERADDGAVAAGIRARRRAGDLFSGEMRQVDPDMKVTTLGKGNTILRLSGPTCGTETLAAFAREHAQRLRGMGFERLECLGRFERAEMTL
jgi:hypothetical protein